MQETTKTKAFVVGAAVMVLAAVISHFANKPRVANDFANVGKPFFEDFQSSDQAKSLEVVALDPETMETKRFKVANVDGLWRIPSHENYPAEASSRLATTASSIIGIERESLAGRGRNDFERLGVEDPLDDEIEDPEAAGQRITLTNENDEVLADYIIGNEVEDVVLDAEQRPFESGENQQTFHYVRRADEQQTYIVPLKIDLSTKFSDWIDPDLLRFETSDLSQITIRNYSLEEQVSGNPLIPQRALVKKVGDTLELTKDGPNVWELAGIDEKSEKFDSGPVTEMVGVLDELRIADVRKKSTFQGKQLLTADLKLNEDPEFAKSPEQFQRAIGRLVAELEEKGFSLAGNQKQLELVSENGEIEFGTSEGLLYTLHVGAPFEEDSNEIDVAGSVDSKSESAEDSNTEGDGDDSDSADEKEGEAGDAKSRYMLVRVQFDESLLENKPEAPVEPTEPEKPAGYEPPPEPEQPETENDSEAGEVDSAAQEVAKSDASSVKESESSDANDDGSDEGESEDADDRPAEFVAYDTALGEYEQAKVDYELALTRFEDDEKRFAERVEEAKKLEKELNERFGEWYYVISGENLKALQITRDELVSANETPASGEGNSNGELPKRPDISFAGGPKTGSAGKLSDDATDSNGSEAVEPESEKSATQDEGSDADATHENEVEAGQSVESETLPKPSTTPPGDVPKAGVVE